MMATMEAGMNAVERQKFYIDNVEREDDTTMLTTTTRWVAVLCLNVKTLPRTTHPIIAHPPLTYPYPPITPPTALARRQRKWFPTRGPQKVPS